VLDDLLEQLLEQRTVGTPEEALGGGPPGRRLESLILTHGDLPWHHTFG